MSRGSGELETFHQGFTDAGAARSGLGNQDFVGWRREADSGATGSARDRVLMHKDGDDLFGVLTTLGAAYAKDRQIRSREFHRQTRRAATALPGW